MEEGWIQSTEYGRQAHRVFTDGKFICNRTPGACKVNASDICDRDSSLRSCTGPEHQTQGRTTRLLPYPRLKRRGETRPLPPRWQRRPRLEFLSSPLNHQANVLHQADNQAAPAPVNQTLTSTGAQSSEGDESWVEICKPEGEACENEDVDIRGKSADDDTLCQNWVVTKKGNELAMAWRVEKEKRDQDAYGMYIFNDWTGYGICEVMENMVRIVDR